MTYRTYSLETRGDLGYSHFRTPPNHLVYTISDCIIFFTPRYTQAVHSSSIFLFPSDSWGSKHVKTYMLFIYIYILFPHFGESTSSQVILGHHPGCHFFWPPDPGFLQPATGRAQLGGDGPNRGQWLCVGRRTEISASHEPWKNPWMICYNGGL